LIEKHQSAARAMDEEKRPYDGDLIWGWTARAVRATLTA
jgi:hypothetical protein